MKEIKLACIVIVGVLIFQSNIHNIQANQVINIGKFIGGILLSKGFDYIWDNETGKTDIPELKRRIKELEETVSETNKNLAEIIREFRNSIKSNISKEDFKIMVKNLDIDLTKRIEDLERHEKITDRQLKDLDNRLAKLEAKGNPNVKDASADSPQKAIISYEAKNYPGKYIRHINALGNISTNEGSTISMDATWRHWPGLADNSLVSLESMNYPGWFLRHQGYRLIISRRDDQELFRKDATFRRVEGLSDTACYSFESFNYPNHYIRIQPKNFELWLARFDGTQLFANDATFCPKFP